MFGITQKVKIIICMSFLLISSCVEEYVPDIDIQELQVYVVEGKITDQGGFHSIYVSKSTKTGNPHFSPIKHCDIKIYDDNNNIFEAEEYENGEYRAYIDEMFLTIGTAFKVEILTPDNQRIVSQYDTIRSCPEVDSIYYFVDETGAPGSEYDIPHLQFYMNYKGNNTKIRNVKIEIEETWKYTVPYPIRWTWNGAYITEYDPPDSSLTICWRTEKDLDIYLLSTQDFIENRYHQYELHAIPNTSFKLTEGYSLLITQYSLSQQAFRYFEQIEENSMSDGGLYDTQPLQVKGNLTNTTNPNERVLGYFYTTSRQTKRKYYGSFEKIIELNNAQYCFPSGLDGGYGLIRNPGQVIYLWFEGTAYQLPDACVDCTSLGGNTTTTKPDFWPN